jgi:hypothetical protein
LKFGNDFNGGMTRQNEMHKSRGYENQECTSKFALTLNNKLQPFCISLKWKHKLNSRIVKHKHMVRTLTSALMYQQKKCCNMVFFLQVSHTWACTSSNWQQWSYESDININSILSMRYVAHFNTKILYNSFLKRRNHKIATQQFCHVQLENSRPSHKIATQKMLCTTWKLKKLHNEHTCVVCCMLEHAICTSMIYSLPWSKTRRSMTTWNWRDWSNYLIWVFQSWSKYAHEGEDVEGDQTFFGNKWWCT